jgi:sigma-B regulation protein RsbU (phosphoserine phosphatase)
MSNLQAAFRGFASPAVSPEALCDKLNSLICRNIASDRFITFFYAQLDGVARQLRYTNAGHNAPIVAHKDGSHDRLREGGGILGVFPVQAFDMGVYDLAAGDRVLLFTDGVTEACNPEGEEFGDARLLELLEENRELSAEDLQRKILSVVAEFCRGHWHDDATLIAIAVA